MAMIAASKPPLPNRLTRRSKPPTTGTSITSPPQREASSSAIARRRGRTPSGSGYSTICIVLYPVLDMSIRASLLLPNSQKNGTPLLLIWIPYGRASLVGTTFNSIFPVFGSRRPTMFPTCTVNQSVPCASKTAVCGSSAVASGILY